MTDPDAEQLPHVALGYQYLPRVCAGPDCSLPPHVRWRVTRGGYLYGRQWRIGDRLDLCPRHEREVVDLYGADWGDSPNVPLQRAERVDASPSRADAERDREPADTSARPDLDDQQPENGQVADLPGYLQADGGSWLLRIPCQRCGAWHTVRSGELTAGELVTVQTLCPVAVDAAGRVVLPKVLQVRVVVQSAKFSWKWERDGRVTTAYLTARHH